MIKNKGFTLVEIMVVISISAIIIAVVIASISESKKRGYDAQVKTTLSEIAFKMESQETIPGVTDYQAAFEAVDVPRILTELSRGLGFPSSAYQFFISPENYAIVFPLKKENYYCIDREGKGLVVSASNSFSENGFRIDDSNPYGSGTKISAETAAGPDIYPVCNMTMPAIVQQAGEDDSE